MQYAAFWGFSMKQFYNFPQFQHLQRKLKRIQTPHSLFKGFGSESEKTYEVKLVCQAAEFRFESKFEPLPVIWQSLSSLKGYS